MALPDTATSGWVKNQAVFFKFCFYHPDAKRARKVSLRLHRVLFFVANDSLTEGLYLR